MYKNGPPPDESASWFLPKGLLQCLLMGHWVHWAQDGSAVVIRLLFLRFLCHIIYVNVPSTYSFFFGKCRRRQKRATSQQVQLPPVKFGRENVSATLWGLQEPTALFIPKLRQVAQMNWIAAVLRKAIHTVSGFKLSPFTTKCVGNILSDNIEGVINTCNMAAVGTAVRKV